MEIVQIIGSLFGRRKQAARDFDAAIRQSHEVATRVIETCERRKLSKSQEIQAQQPVEAQQQG